MRIVCCRGKGAGELRHRERFCRPEGPMCMLRWPEELVQPWKLVNSDRDYMARRKREGSGACDYRPTHASLPTFLTEVLTPEKNAPEWHSAGVVLLGTNFRSSRATGSQSTQNEREAHLAVLTAITTMARFPSIPKVCILTPYGAQHTLLTSLVRDPDLLRGIARNPNFPRPRLHRKMLSV